MLCCCTGVVWLCHLNGFVGEDTGCAEDNPFHTLKSLVVPHRADGVVTRSSGARGTRGSNGLTKSVREGEQHVAGENWQHKTIDCLIHEGTEVSFNAVDGGSPSWDQPMRTIIDSKYCGSWADTQLRGKRRSQYCSLRTSGLHHHSVREAVCGETFPVPWHLWLSVTSPDAWSTYTFKHSVFKGASGNFCVEVQAGLSEHRTVAPLHCGTKCSIQGPKILVRPLSLNREDQLMSYRKDGTMKRQSSNDIKLLILVKAVSEKRWKERTPCANKYQANTGWKTIVKY